MKSIEFLGAVGGEVTGSSFLLTADDGGQILVDFGMFQGKKETQAKNYDLLAFDPSVLQGVFLTHAHLDHCGRLPLLAYGGFHSKIYLTGPTRALIKLILNDSARIATEDSAKEPLYSEREVQKILQETQMVEYNTEVSLKSFKAIFRDAGHILGSASIEITDLSSENHETIVFSGDLGNTPENIVRPTQYIDAADYVVMESTYGATKHPEENPAQIIQEEINIIEKTNAVLLIPAFSIERTQELLHILHHLKTEGKIAEHTPIFLDSPMGIEATSIYLQFRKYYNIEMLTHEANPFYFEGLDITADARESRAILQRPTPKVIIAGSGMMSGGRVMHHAVNYLEDDKNRVLLVGYQAEETIGRQILEGATSVRIDKKTVVVRAHISEIKTLSSHADQPKLLTWISHIKGVKKVFLTHGETPSQLALSEKIKTELKIADVIIPNYGQQCEL